MKQYLIAVAAAAILTACGSGGHEGHNHTSTAPTNELDSLRKAALEPHDVVMPKMGRLKSYKADITKVLDSLKSSKASAAVVARYEALLTQVNAAEKSMNDWMDGFDYDLEAKEDSLKLYFADQKKKAEKMRDIVLAALDSSQAVIGN